MTTCVSRQKRSYNNSPLFESDRHNIYPNTTDYSTRIFCSVIVLKDIILYKIYLQKNTLVARLQSHLELLAVTIIVTPVSFFTNSILFTSDLRIFRIEISNIHQHCYRINYLVSTNNPQWLYKLKQRRKINSTQFLFHGSMPMIL